VTAAETTSSDGVHQTQILHSNLANGTATLRLLHARLQPLLLFFIDAASMIDQEDPNWDILIAVEIPASENINMAPRILGFATLYKFWVFPDRQRMRISQVLVLPPYQGTGVGKLLVESAYKIADKRNVIDITMEDPTEDMQRIRDRIDLQRMLQGIWPHEAASSAIRGVLNGAREGQDMDDGKGVRNLRPLRASAELLQRMRKDFRLSRQQAKRMWESLLYKVALELGAYGIGAVEEFIHSTLESQVLEAKQESQEKKMVMTEGQGFVLFKQKSKKNGFKNPSADQSTLPVEEMSEEKQRAAISEAVNERIEELNRLCSPSNALIDQENEEEEEGQGEDIH
jgi:histone acetyltransferase 1